MKTKHEYGNKSEVSELDDEIAEEFKFKHDNENAIAAFLFDQRHHVFHGNATPDGVRIEPAGEAELHTDVIYRGNRAFDNRRKGVANDRRKGDRRIAAG